MKRLLSWLLALVMIISCLPLSALPAFAEEPDVDVDAGSTETTEEDFTVEWDDLTEGMESNPIDLTQDLLHEEDFTATVTVPAGKTLYYCAYRVGGMVMTINGGEGTVCGGNMMMPHTWSITNDGAADAEYVIVVTLPVGTIDNPATLVLGENVATVAAGAQGYFYTYTAEQAGTLVLEIATNAAGWTYAVNNLTTYAYGDTQWSDSDPVVNPYEVEVAAGDELQIMVCTYDATNPWNAPAGTVTVNASYKVEEPEYVPYLINVDRMSLDLNAELILKFRVEIPEELKADSGAYLKVTIAGNERIIPMTEFATTLSSTNRGYVNTGVASPYMDKEVTLQIFDGNGNLANFYYKDTGVTTEGSISFTAVDGAVNYIKTAPAYNSVLEGLLTYGGYAQAYFKANPALPISDIPVYNVLAENGLAVGDLTQITAADFDKYAVTVEGDVGLSARNISVALDSAVYMEYSFNSVSTDCNPADYQFKLTQYNAATRQYETIDVVPVVTTLTSGKTRFTLRIENIAAALWDNNYVLTVTNTATNSVMTYTACVMSFVQKNLTAVEGTAMADLFKAMYFYNQRASQLFGI